MAVLRVSYAATGRFGVSTLSGFKRSDIISKVCFTKLGHTPN